MKLSVLNVVGVLVDNNYKWKDDIFLGEDICSYDEKIYKNCKNIIKIKYSKKVNFENARQIEKNIFACNEYLYDKEKGVKIYFEDQNTCVLEANQEINEWLIIMLQVMLLKEGYSFIHAAAVVNKTNDCLLMPSWGGVGKTATVAKLIKNGYKLLGDDLNVLSSDGKIYGFPKKFVLYFYHRDLFPEVFKKKNIKCNSTLNKFYSAIIPTVKHILRKIPGVLSFARKHNPQSMKVSPYEIFGKDKIGKIGEIREIFWLEREISKNYVQKIDMDVVISKAVSVTMLELFNENLETILIMCGMNILNYDEIFRNMYKIYEIAFKKARVHELCVDRNKPVECVADSVIENITI